MHWINGCGGNSRYRLPPARIRTCATNASGSYLGFWRESGALGAGGQFWGGYPEFAQLTEAFPCHAVSLTSPFHLLHEPGQRSAIEGDTVVIDMPLNQQPVSAGFS